MRGSAGCDPGQRRGVWARHILEDMGSEKERDEILEACCRDGQAAQVVFESQGILVRGAFVRRDADRLVVGVWGELAEAPELPAACCVTFVRGVRTFAFVTRARGISRGEAGQATLDLDVPELVAAAEARRHPRLPVPPEAPLEAEVKGVDGVARKGLGLDVSFGGMRLELIEGGASAEELRPGSPVGIRLGLGDLRLELEGRVAHRTEGHVGIHLAEAAMPGMRGLVGQIEAEWLVGARNLD
jgi:hypothetical protein